MSPQQCRLRLTLRGHTPHCARGVPVRTSRTTDEAACWLPAPWRGAAAAKRSQAGRGNSLHTDVDAAGRPRAAPCKSEWRASNLPNCAAACPLLSLGRTASAFSTRTVLSAQYQSPHSAPPSEPGRVLEPWVVVRQSVPLRRPCRRRPDPRWRHIGLGPGLYRPPPDCISACDGHSMHIGPSRPKRKSLSRVVAARSTSPAKRVSASRCR